MKSLTTVSRKSLVDCSLSPNPSTSSRASTRDEGIDFPKAEPYSSLLITSSTFLLNSSNTSRSSGSERHGRLHFEEAIDSPFHRNRYKSAKRPQRTPKHASSPDFDSAFVVLTAFEPMSFLFLLPSSLDLSTVSLLLSSHFAFSFSCSISLHTIKIP